MTDEQWVKIAEASKQCKVPRTKIYKLIDEGKVREKGNGVKKVNLPDLINALQGEDTGDMPKVDTAIQSEEGLELRRMLYEKGCKTYDELQETIKQLRKQIEQSEQQKRDIDRQVFDAGLLLKDKQRELKYTTEDLANIQGKVDRIIEDAEKQANAIKADAIVRIGESDAMAKDTAQQAQSELSEVRAYRAQVDEKAQAVINYTEHYKKLVEWSNRFEQKRDIINQTLAGIQNLLEKREQYIPKTLVELLGKYLDFYSIYLRGADIKPLPDNADVEAIYNKLQKGVE